MADYCYYWLATVEADMEHNEIHFSYPLVVFGINTTNHMVDTKITIHASILPRIT